LSFSPFIFKSFFKIRAHPATCVAGPGFPGFRFAPFPSGPGLSHRTAPPLHSLARAKNGIPAVFRLQVFAKQKPGKSIHAGIHTGPATPAIAIRGGLSHWILPAAKSISPPAAESRFTALAVAHTAA
jgi:hypothetical protein